MHNWKVRLVTKGGQNKEVTMYDFNYPRDAESAALSQNDGVSIISSCIYIPHPSSSFTIENRTKNTNSFMSADEYDDCSYDPSFDYVEHKTSKYDDLYSYLGVMLLFSPLSLIFLFVSPILFILIQIAFAYWWFSR